MFCEKTLLHIKEAVVKLGTHWYKWKNGGPEYTQGYKDCCEHILGEIRAMLKENSEEEKSTKYKIGDSVILQCQELGGQFPYEIFIYDIDEKDYICKTAISTTFPFKSLITVPIQYLDESDKYSLGEGYDEDLGKD